MKDMLVSVKYNMISKNKDRHAKHCDFTGTH